MHDLLSDGREGNRPRVVIEGGIAERDYFNVGGEGGLQPASSLEPSQEAFRDEDGEAGTAGRSKSGREGGDIK